MPLGRNTQQVKGSGSKDPNCTNRILTQTGEELKANEVGALGEGSPPTLLVGT